MDPATVKYIAGLSVVSFTVIFLFLILNCICRCFGYMWAEQLFDEGVAVTKVTEASRSKVPAKSVVCSSVAYNKETESVRMKYFQNYQETDEDR